MLREMLLQRARRVEADKIMVEQVPEMVAAAAGQGMAMGRDENQPIGREGKAFESGMVDEIGCDPDLGEAIGDEAHDVVTRLLLEIDVDIRMRGEKAAEDLGQELAQRRGV